MTYITNPHWGQAVNVIDVASMKKPHIAAFSHNQLQNTCAAIVWDLSIQMMIQMTMAVANIQMNVTVATIETDRKHEEVMMPFAVGEKCGGGRMMCCYW